MYKAVYVSVSITRYSEHFIKPRCGLWQIIDGEPIEKTELEYSDACKLAWELVLIGGERTVRINPYDPSISEVEVTYYMPH